MKTNCLYLSLIICLSVAAHAETDKQTYQEVAKPQQEQPAQQAPGLTLQDLVLVAQIIQLGSQRGTFRAEELEQVGGLYNKLVAFLQSTGAIAPAPAASDDYDDEPAPVAKAAPAPAPAAPAQESTGGGDSRAQDILAMIRNRQKQ